MQKICPSCAKSFDIYEGDGASEWQCPECGHTMRQTRPKYTSAARSTSSSTVNLSALVECSDCSAYISKRALACPECGRHKLCGAWTLMTYIVLVSWVIGFFVVLIANCR